MKQLIFLFFIAITDLVFSQQVLVKTFETTSNTIELATFGLDEIKIINTRSNKITVSLYDENPNSHTIITEEASGILKIGFELAFIEASGVFRKFITKRLNRASVVIKIPKNKAITIYGDDIDVISKSYEGDLNIYIDEGMVKLHKVKANVMLKLFQGNVFAAVTNTSIAIVSNKGTIKINDTIHPKKYQKEIKSASKYFKLHSINGNVTLLNYSKI